LRAEHADSEVIILAVIVVVLALCLLLVFLCLICTQLRKWYRKRRLSRIVIPDLYAQIDNVTIAGACWRADHAAAVDGHSRSQ